MPKVSKKKFYELAELYRVPVDDEKARDDFTKAVLNDFINAITDEFNKPKNKWIAWSGGDCPINPKAMVKVKFRCGVAAGEAQEFYWWHDDEDYDIIAYKIVED